MEDRLIGCFEGVFPELTRAQIADASMRTLAAWDSLALLQLLMRIEREFGLRFEREQVRTFTSFRAIFDTLRSLHS